MRVRSHGSIGGCCLPASRRRTEPEELIKRSDAFAGIRNVQKKLEANNSRLYSQELRTAVQNVSGLNLTGKAGEQTNRLAVEYHHALELQMVKSRNWKALAEERLKHNEQLAELLKSFAADNGDGKTPRHRPSKRADSDE